jgi:hypothetical protein
MYFFLQIQSTHTIYINTYLSRFILKGIAKVQYQLQTSVLFARIKSFLEPRIGAFFYIPTPISLSEDNTTCFSSYYDKDSATIFTTGRLTDVNPP